jgi:ketosteroid isomerase-like protein
MSITSSETLAIAQTAFQDFAQGLTDGDWSPFLAHVSEDFTFWFPAGPFKGLNTGKDRAREFFDMVSRVFPEGLSLTVERVLTGGNTVLFEVRSQGLMMGHPYENQAALSFDIRGDQVCGYREYLGVIFQLGG